MNFFKAFFFILLVSCYSQEKSLEKAPLSANEKLYRKGKAVYMSNCTACHHLNPKLAGALGPEVYGSSLPLLKARIMTLSYPPGYTPKRKTKMMLEMPELESDIPAIHYFLNH